MKMGYSYVSIYYKWLHNSKSGVRNAGSLKYNETMVLHNSEIPETS